MASQTLSGYATEGTQYSVDGSYYVLDSIPGSGNVLDGPITVAGNLTTTGNTSVLGSLGSAGPLTAATVNTSNVSPSAGQTTPLIVTGLAAGVTVTSSGPTIVNGGSVAVSATTGNLTMQSVSSNVLISRGATSSIGMSNDVTVLNTTLDGKINLTTQGNLGGINIVANGATGVVYLEGGFGVQLANASSSTSTPNRILATGSYTSVSTGNFEFPAGLYLNPGMGTFAASQLISGGINMVGNKGVFRSTSGDVASVVIFDPRVAPNGVALYGKVGTNAFAPALAVQNGSALTITWDLVSAPQSTFWIVVM